VLLFSLPPPEISFTNDSQSLVVPLLDRSSNKLTVKVFNCNFGPVYGTEQVIFSPPLSPLDSLSLSKIDVMENLHRAILSYVNSGQLWDIEHNEPVNLQGVPDAKSIQIIDNTNVLATVSSDVQYRFSAENGVPLTNSSEQTNGDPHSVFGSLLSDVPGSNPYFINDGWTGYLCTWDMVTGQLMPITSDGFKIHVDLSVSQSDEGKRYVRGQLENGASNDENPITSGCIYDLFSRHTVVAQSEIGSPAAPSLFASSSELAHGYVVPIDFDVSPLQTCVATFESFIDPHNTIQSNGTVFWALQNKKVELDSANVPANIRNLLALAKMLHADNTQLAKDTERTR